MTGTLNLRPELEAGLLAQAQAGGKTLEEYLLSMVERLSGSRNRSSRVAALISRRYHGQRSRVSSRAAKSIVVACLEKIEALFGDAVYQAMFLGDAP